MLGRLFFRPLSRPAGSFLVCGGTEFEQRPVMGEELIVSWQLAPDEAAHIDRQPGHLCLACQSNLRSRTLATALLDHFGFAGIPGNFCATSRQGGSEAVVVVYEK